MSGIHFEFVELHTADGLTLPAGYLAGQERFAGPIDAVMLNPASTGSFYNPFVLTFARRFAAAGLPCVTISTRGDDTIWQDSASTPASSISSQKKS